VEALRTLFPFRACYIADLDAIRGMGHHRALVGALQARWPEIAFWVDAGLAAPQSCREWRDAGIGHLVVGSESQTDPDTLAAAVELVGAEHVALSLDFRGGAFLGPPALHEQPALWPERVIAMTLDRVGAGTGPDLERLAAIGARKPGIRLWAAGGVRGPEDLEALSAAGIDSVLVASALHDGRLDGRTLARFSS
jgi:phosphoribosylformimino-5-aminoimidazole carboxamide ribotide isomerase